MSKLKVISIMGPTASGKTDLALYLADQFPCRLISVDSALIYRGMDIGTAKPDEKMLEKYPHHLVNILAPTETYSVAAFCRDACREIDIAFEKNQVPVLVGGTFLYFNALQKGIHQLPKTDSQVRGAIQGRLEAQGLEALYVELQKRDPVTAEKLHANDRQRITRALEVLETTGRPLSDWRAGEKATLTPYNFQTVVIEPSSRDQLHARIAQRLEYMWSAGFTEEVKVLREGYVLSSNMPSMRCVGYRQVWGYLEGAYDEKTMREKALFATRQLAKRQCTWLRRWEAALRLESDDPQRFASLEAFVHQ